MSQINLRKYHIDIVIQSETNSNLKLLQLCKVADCFVHPSIREGFGIAPMEAMASGLPLISAYVNGIKDYTQDGQTGICINPKLVQEMLDSIYKMYNNKEFRLLCENL